MAQVDPVTGQPMSEVTKPVSPAYERLNEQRGAADQLSADIQSENGQLILNKIQQHLLNRVNKLIDDDGECRSLKKVLVDMGVTLNIGEMAVDRLMRLVTRK